MDFKNASELLALCTQQQLPISEIMRRRECQLGETTRDEVTHRMKRALEIMRSSALTPLKTPVKSMGGLIGGEAKKLAQHAAKGRSICGDVLHKAAQYAMAVLEVNASMGLIVAAPTAGSAGVLPGMLFALQDRYNISDERLIDALFNAGAVGYLAMRNATVAGAVGGCQAEVGIASAMAASAAVELMGGKEAFAEKLDNLYVEQYDGVLKSTFLMQYPDATGLMGQFCMGNEPSFHIPWVYNWLGRPDKTSKVINRILNEQYTSAPDGLPGNDDLGTMGAWYVFACTGLYPMIPGVGGFTLSTPVFDKVVIHLKHGDITITGGSEKRIYTTALKLDGKPYGSTWIGWDALRNGATLEYTTSAKPSGNWGRTQLPPSYE